MPQAFAVVQAPEAAVETCHATTPRAAQECALAKCQKKAGRGACFSVTVCAPSGWAGIMGVRVKEVHFTDSVCGAPTREAAIAALRAFCIGHMPQAEQCFVSQLWGPDGKPHALELSWAPTDLKEFGTKE